jgi:hypothetical protein
MLIRQDPKARRVVMKSKCERIPHCDSILIEYREDDEDDELALMMELEKIKRERAEQRAKEVCCSAYILIASSLTATRKQKRLQKNRRSENTTLQWEILC